MKKKSMYIGIAKVYPCAAKKKRNKELATILGISVN
jgi:hypothetical protein